jgi:hypothetical protein
MFSAKAILYLRLAIIGLLPLLAIFACNKIGPQHMPEQTNEQPQKSKAPPPPELVKFVFESDRFTNEVVPRRLDAVVVADFLNERIDGKAPLKVLLQAEKVAAFYDTHEIAEHYRSILNGIEQSDDVLRRRIVIDRTIARVGKPEDVDAAKQVYEQVAPRVQSLPEFHDIIALHDVLAMGNSSTTLKRTLDARIAALGPQTDGNDPVRLEYLELQETISQKLDDANRAAAEKAEILSKTSRKERIVEEIKAYLAIDYGFIEYLQPWAAMRLRRETWAPRPEEQIVREEKAELKTEVVDSFRRMLGEVDALVGPDEEDKEAAKIQVLRAIKFFGGEISEEDEQFLLQFRGTQADILANEGFLLP